jgi:hypothetical protein
MKRLLRGHREDCANLDYFHSPVLVSPALFVHSSTKRPWVEIHSECRLQELCRIGKDQQHQGRFGFGRDLLGRSRKGSNKSPANSLATLLRLPCAAAASHTSKLVAGLGRRIHIVEASSH